MTRLDEVITFLSKLAKQKDEAISFDYRKIIKEYTQDLKRVKKMSNEWLLFFGRKSQCLDLLSEFF